MWAEFIPYNVHCNIQYMYIHVQTVHAQYMCTLCVFHVQGVEREVGGIAVDQQSVVQHLVCKQSKRNITGRADTLHTHMATCTPLPVSPETHPSLSVAVIFGPVREFVKDIETALCLQG